MGTDNWNDIYIIYELKTNALIHISYKSNLWVFCRCSGNFLWWQAC